MRDTAKQRAGTVNEALDIAQLQLDPAHIIADGRFHRCPTADRPGSSNGSYKIFTGDTGALQFCCENFRTGVKVTAPWISSNSPATPHFARQGKASPPPDFLAGCEPCTEHPYLTRKGATACEGLYQDRHGNLVVPMFPFGAENAPPCGAQRISPTGGKRNARGGTSGHFRIPGDATHPIYIVEGLATGLSVHEATGAEVWVSFGKGGLENAARHAQTLHPTRRRIVAGDNDADAPENPGKASAEAAARATGSMVALPEVPGDWNDVHSSLGVEAAAAMLAKAAHYLPTDAVEQTRTPRLKPLALGDFLEMAIPQREAMLHPAILEQSLNMLYAQRGVGKTWLALELAYAVATGGTALGRWAAPQPRKVLYIDGEMCASDLQARLRAVAGGSPSPAPAGFFSLITPDMHGEGGLPDIASPEGQAEWNATIAQCGAELIVLDNLACLRKSGKENDSDSVRPIQSWLLSLKRQGKSVLLVHHAGKGGLAKGSEVTSRGSSALEDTLDVVIQLRRPEGYSPDHGARFVVQLTKARHLTGPDARPFEAHLTRDASGGQQWVTQAPSGVEGKREVARGLKQQGYSLRQIEEETGIPRSTIARLTADDE